MTNKFYDFAHTSASLVHCIQRERGFVAAYLKSKGVIFKDRLKQHFSHTDEMLTEFLKWDNNDFPQTEENYNEVRAKIIALDIADHVALDFYTYKLINPLLQNMAQNVAEYLPDCDKTHSVYNAFLQWKENLGLERALGTRALIQNTDTKISYDEFTSRLNLLMQKEVSNKQICLLLANDKQKNIFDNLQHNTDSLLDDIQAGIKAGQSLSSLIDYELTPEKWFHLTDEKMDRLHVCEKQLIDIIQSEGEQQGVATPKAEPLKHLKDYLGFLKTLPLFNDIEESTLNYIFAEAHLKRCDKGEVLFEQQELPHYFYIILEGWVKIGSISPEGEEVVLQILSGGEFIMEHATVLNMPCPASATAVKQTKLLTIPAGKMRQYISENHKLALNLLSVMAGRSQSFMWHIENMRSHNAEHRLGWFLLRLLLDNKEAQSQVRLPYDKGVIASYLNMKPETLSRAFKKLKTQGFDVSGDTITIPDFVTLCEFCNLATAEMCHMPKSANFCHQL